MSALEDQPRWLLLWAVDPLGQCCCSGGSWRGVGDHGEAFGGPGTCAHKGKHPWRIQKNGQPYGFRHGALDALPYQELLSTYGPVGGSRRLGYTLQDLVLLDLDSEAALQAFYRIQHHVPKDKLLGIARTPRGWHVLLDVPGWTQRALNAQMRTWLRDWHGTDPGRITRRGLLLDVRTGAGRYAVWPESQERGRRWASATEFRAALEFSGRGMPRSRMVQDGADAPWNLQLDGELRARIAEFDTPPGAAPVRSASEGGARSAWAELEHWCRGLELMPPETGRNNALNQTAFLSGRRAVAAGVPVERVRDRLRLAAERCGCPGAEATIRSGLLTGAAR